MEENEVLNHKVETKLTPEQMSNKTVTQLAVKYGGVLMPDGAFQFPDHDKAQTFAAVVWDWTGISIEIPST
jgi:hypothetical protein